MTESSPNVERWRRLYNLALEVKKLQPWKFLEETQLMAVEIPGTSETLFLSVMGLLGEHYAVAAYIGASGYWGFQRLQSAGSSPNDVFEMPHLQVSFEDSDSEDAQDRAVRKELGLKLRGAGAYPIFRSWRPGCFPWFITENESASFQVALEQFLEVFEQPEDVPFVRKTEPGRCWTRRLNKDTMQWHNELVSVPRLSTHSLRIRIDPNTVEAIGKLRPAACAVEADVVMMPSPVQDKPSARPYFPYSVLLVETERGLILSCDLLSPLPDMDAMWGKVPDAILRSFVTAGLLPKEIRVRTPLLAELLRPLREFGVDVKPLKKLPALMRAESALLQRFGRGY